MCVRVCARFSPAGPEAVFIAARLASVLGDVRTDGSEKRSVGLRRNETDPVPDSLSWGPPSHPNHFFLTRLHPPQAQLSTLPYVHFWTCADNRISRELSKQAALCCNAGRMCVCVCVRASPSVFWTWHKLDWIRWVSVAAALSALNRVKKVLVCDAE